MLTAGALVNVQTVAYFQAHYGVAGRQACLRLVAVLFMPLLLCTLALNWLALGISHKPGYAAANMFALSIPVNMAAGVLTASLLGEMRYGTFWLIRAGTASATAFGVLLLSATHQLDAMTYCLMAVLVWLATLCVALVIQRPGIRGQPTPEKGMVRKALRFGIATNGTLLPYQLNLRIDHLLISLVLPASALGVYSAAFAWSSTLSLIGGAFSVVVLSETAQVDPRDRESFRRAVSRVRRGCVVVIAAGVAAALAAPVAVPLIFGDLFAKAIRPAQILCLAAVVLNVNLMVHEFARGAGRPGLGGFPESLGILVSAGMLWWLLPSHFVTGAAIASLASYLVILIAVLWNMARGFPHLESRMLVPNQSDVGRIWLTAVGEARRLLGLAAE